MLKGRRKICLYLTDEAHSKLQTARTFGQTTNQAISKAIKELLQKPEEIRPIRRKRIYVRIPAVRFLFLSRLCRQAGLTFSQFVDLALRRHTPLDPIKEAEAMLKKLQTGQNSETRPSSDFSGLEFQGGGGEPSSNDGTCVGDTKRSHLVHAAIQPILLFLSLFPEFLELLPYLCQQFRTCEYVYTRHGEALGRVD